MVNGGRRRRRRWPLAAGLLCACSWQTPAGPEAAPPVEQTASAVEVPPDAGNIEATPAAVLPAPAALPALAVRPVPEGPALPPVSAFPLRPFIGTQRDPVTVMQRLARAQVRSMKPVGSTSTVFKVDLSGSVDAAFKSTTEDRPAGPAGEVAAYRLSRCLGLRTVPPAVSREVPLDTLQAMLEPQLGARWPVVRKRLVVTPRRTVWVAAIYWVPELTDLGIDDAAGIARWSPWLRLDGALPVAQRQLAASISTMLAWDYLIGNFDRFSGSNAQAEATRTEVVLRDHDVAFAPHLSERLHARIRRRMLRAQRFSRSFIAALRALTAAQFQAELSRDPAWAERPLVSPAALAAVFERRATLLSHVDALIAAYGSEAVLVFE